MTNQMVDLLIQQTADAWEMIRSRVEGLMDAEFLWKPTLDCWMIRLRENGRWELDYDPQPPQPPPFTTIAWRIVLIAACKWMYYEYAFGPGLQTWDDLEYPHTAQAAAICLEQDHQLLVNKLQTLIDPDLEKTRMTNWGEQWPTWRIFWGMAFHDIHHGAEIGVLRDLYRFRVGEVAGGNL
jgi:hypothetical protein